MYTFKSSAIDILKKSEGPLHYSEITKRAIEEGLLETEGATPDATMNAQISTDIKANGANAIFVRVSQGVYGLNESRLKKIAIDQITDEEQEQEEKIIIDSSFTGKAGENRVCSELLFRGFNASIMSVDVGMDIIAVKDSQLFGVQVKTSNLNKYETYVFDIRKVSFERHTRGNIFYIFVLHGDDQDHFLILPFHEIEKKVHEKAILEVGHGKRYRVTIKFRSGKVFLGNVEHEMGYFLNNWNLIR